jgi:hypothetical protein
MEYKEKLGDIIEYDGRSKKAKVKLTGNLEEGDRVHIEGERTDFQQRIDSLERDDKDNRSVWILVDKSVEKGDELMKSYEGEIEKKYEGEIEKKDEGEFEKMRGGCV